MLKNRIIYAALLAVLFLFYVFCNAYISVYIIYLLVAVTAAGAALSFAASRKITVSASGSITPENTKKRMAEFCMRVENASVIPAPLVIFETEFRDISESGSVRRKITTSAAISEKKELFISLEAPYAALIEANVRKVRVCDPFGIIAFPAKSGASNARLLMMPSRELFRRDYPKCSAPYYDSDMYSDTQKGDDRSQVFEVRDYRDGDDIRNIHWRLSSKLDTLIVKEFSKPVEERCTVLIETSLACGCDSGEVKARADKVLAEYISLAAYLIENERPFVTAMYSPSSGKLVSFEIKGFEDTAAVLRAFLSERLPDEPFLSHKTFYADPANTGTAVYYIFDSLAAGEEKLPNANSIVFIDADRADGVR